MRQQRLAQERARQRATEYARGAEGLTKLERAVLIILAGKVREQYTTGDIDLAELRRAADLKYPPHGILRSLVHKGHMQRLNNADPERPDYRILVPERRY